jgi:hypothetical protein
MFSSNIRDVSALANYNPEKVPGRYAIAVFAPLGNAGNSVKARRR